MFCGSRFREKRRTSVPLLYARRRMPSNLRSKIHSGPVKRSWVSVAAIGSSHSGKSLIGCRSIRVLLRFSPVNSWLQSAGVALFTFVAMLVVFESGYRIGQRQAARKPTAHEGTGPIEAAIFALLGLLFGFAFAGATSRLEARRQLIVQEANDIGTAYLRIDLLPPDAQPAMRHAFRQ